MQHLLQCPPSFTILTKFLWWSYVSLLLTLPPSVFPCCQNSDRRMKCGQELIFSSAVRKPTALCANHNRRSPPSSPLVQQSGTRFSVKERKTTWSEKVWAYAERHHGGTTIHSSNKPHSNILPKPIRERVNSVHKSLRARKKENNHNVYPREITMLSFQKHKCWITIPLTKNTATLLKENNH